jgi:PTS system nitrogen regulatory IIA component
LDRLRPLLEGILAAEGVFDLPSGLAKRQVVDLVGKRAAAAARVEPAQVGEVLEALWKREQILSTGIGLGIGVPHVRHEAVKDRAICVGRSKAGIPFDAIDGKPVYAVFAILMPAGEHRHYIQVLGAIAAALKAEARRTAVFAAPDGAAFVDRLLAPI